MTKIRLTVFMAESELPAFLTVKDFCGNVVFYGILTQKKKTVVFCNKGGGFTVSVKPFGRGVGIIRHINTPKIRCFNLSVFLRTPVDYDVWRQDFYLEDKNYGFPIDFATLIFR